MACALASQLSRKAPNYPGSGYDISGKEGKVADNLGTKMKYIDLITKHSELQCKSCLPTGAKCKISLLGTNGNGKVRGSPDPPGAIVNSYIFTKDETLNYGLAEGMFKGVEKMFSKIGEEEVLNFSDNDICRQYAVGIIRNDNGREQPAWCTISDGTIKNMDLNNIRSIIGESQNLANKVRNGEFDYEKNKENCVNNGGTWDSNDKTCSSGQTSTSRFQNMKNNKLNPQNLTFDDDISMKVYYGLLGVGGIYLLYQLSKKYGNKLNLD